MMAGNQCFVAGSAICLRAELTTGEGSTNTAPALRAATELNASGNSTGPRTSKGTV